MTTHTGGILVIRGGAIGDFILTLPVLAALRAHFPGARLEVLGYRHIVELALVGGLADEVCSIEARALAGFFADGAILAPEWESYFGQFDIILSFLYDPEGTFERNVRRCGKGQFIAGPHRPNEREPVPATEVFLRPLQRLAIFEADPVPALRLDSALVKSQVALQGTLALHPGSGSERKNWPESHWAKVLDGLLDRSSRKLLLVGGEAELERCHRLAARVPPDRLHRAIQLPLPELAARLANASMLIGHDSGISHLAAALGIEVLILWGETAEAIWRPQGPRVRLLRSARGLNNLDPAAVLQDLNARL